MNLSAAVMLVNKAVRPLKVEYDPDTYKNNTFNKNFKTIDATLKKGDLVVVETHTRHGFTIGKVTEIDFAVDFNDPTLGLGRPSSTPTPSRRFSRPTRRSATRSPRSKRTRCGRNSWPLTAWATWTSLTWT